MRRADTRARAALRLPSGMGMDGIGILGSVLIPSSPVMESSTIHSAGVSILPGSRLELRILVTATVVTAMAMAVIVISVPAIIPPIILAAGPRRSLGTRTALV